MNRDPGHTTADDEDRAQEFLRAKLCGAAFSDDELAACCERVSGVPRALASPRLLVPDRKLTREEYRVFGFCLIALSGQLGVFRTSAEALAYIASWPESRARRALRSEDLLAAGASRKAKAT